MNVVLWVLQVLLGALFVYHAWMMLWPARERLQQGGMRYVVEMPAGLRIFAGVAEGLAGIGLILPAITHILPWLTPLAAAGLAVLMVGAIVFHIPRAEYPNVAFNLMLGILAAFIAYGRWVLQPL